MRASLITAVLFSFLVLPCWSWAADSAVELGALPELSGPNAVNGTFCRQGVEAAHAAFAGTVPFEVRLVVADSRGSAAVGVTEFQRLSARDELLAVIINRAQIAMALNPLSRRQKLPLLALAPHPDLTRQNPYGFQFWPSAAVEGRALAALIQARNLPSLAIVTVQDAYPLALREQLKSRLPRSVEVLRDELIEEDVQDLRSIAQRLVQSRPAAVYVNASVSQGGTLIRQLREQGFRGQLFGNYWMSLASTIRAAGESNIEGLVFFEPGSVFPTFAEDFATRFPNQPSSPVAVCCYQAAAAVFSALQSFAAPPTREEFYREFASRQNFALQGKALQMLAREAQLPLLRRVIRGGVAVAHD